MDQFDQRNLINTVRSFLLNENIQDPPDRYKDRKNLNDVPYKYNDLSVHMGRRPNNDPTTGTRDRPRGRPYPKLADPVGGLWPYHRVDPNEYVTRIMPVLKDAVKKKITRGNLYNIFFNQFGVNDAALSVAHGEAIMDTYRKIGGV
jgi:hypothetical protein